MVTQDLYQGQEQTFAQFSQHSFAWKYIEQPAIDRHLTPFFTPDISVLEAGCGNGRIVKHLLSRGLAPIQLVGLDQNTQLLKVAREQNPDVTFIEDSLTNTKSVQTAFDVITCSMVLETQTEADFRVILKNFFTWLKPGGKLLFIVPHPLRFIHGDLSTYLHRERRLENTPWNIPIPYNHRTIGDYVNTTIEAGLTIVTVDEPELLTSLAQTEPVEYKKYNSSPARLVVLAQKPTYSL